MNRRRAADPTTAPIVHAEATPPTDWDAFLEGTPGATFCHLAAWRDVLGDVLGHRCFHVTARAPDGALRGALPLVRVKSRLFGHYLVSMPFLNYGGPVGDEEARAALAAWAVDRARADRVDLLELRWRPSALGERAHADSGDTAVSAELTLTSRKVTVLLPLPDDAQTLWDDGLRSKVRSQVRRPMKEGFQERFGPAEVEPFYEVFAQNMRDLGTPVLPLAFFQRLPDAFGDRVVFTNIYDGDRPIAGGCGFHFGGEFEITWASSLREYSRAAPNMLLYWRMMENAIERGASAFNFGRCTPGGGTHRFKLQWGGEDEPLPWGVWSPDGEAATPNPDQGKYKLATSIWSRLPVPLTRVVGPPLARRIP